LTKKRYGVYLQSTCYSRYRRHRAIYRASLTSHLSTLPQFKPSSRCLPRYEVFQACHQPGETYSSWISTRLAEWAALSTRTDELVYERRSGWRFPVLATQAHHSAFYCYLHDWLATKNKPKDHL